MKVYVIAEETTWGPVFSTLDNALAYLREDREDEDDYGDPRDSVVEVEVDNSHHSQIHDG